MVVKGKDMIKVLQLNNVEWIAVKNVLKCFDNYKYNKFGEVLRSTSSSNPVQKQVLDFFFKTTPKCNSLLYQMNETNPTEVENLVKSTEFICKPTDLSAALNPYVRNQMELAALNRCIN